MDLETINQLQHDFFVRVLNQSRREFPNNEDLMQLWQHLEEGVTINVTLCVLTDNKFYWRIALYEEDMIQWVSVISFELLPALTEHLRQTPIFEKAWQKFIAHQSKIVAEMYQTLFLGR